MSANHSDDTRAEYDTEDNSMMNDAQEAIVHEWGW